MHNLSSLGSNCSQTAISGTTHANRNKIWIHTFQDLQALPPLISSGCWMCLPLSIGPNQHFFIFSKRISYMYKTHTYTQKFSDHSSRFCKHTHVHTAGIIHSCNPHFVRTFWCAVTYLHIKRQLYHSEYTCRKHNYPNTNCLLILNIS
jgi:hypothetical protein